jgi:hypothetical protein
MAFSAFSAPLTRNEHPEEIIPLVAGPFAAAALANTTVSLFVLDRACDIMSITLRAGTAGSAHGLTFRVAPSGTAAASGTAITATETADGLTGATPFNIALTQTNSPHLNLAAGTVIALSGAASLATLADLVITVRIRNRTYRTTTAGNKQWDTPNPAI